jgi:hypothetical protein
MPSCHKVPYCWGLLEHSQDWYMRVTQEIKNTLRKPPRCKHCGCEISNEDVTDCVPLLHLISRVKVNPNTKLSDISWI